MKIKNKNKNTTTTRQLFKCYSSFDKSLQHEREYEGKSLWNEGGTKGHDNCTHERQHSTTGGHTRGDDTEREAREEKEPDDEGRARRSEDNTERDNLLARRHGADWQLRAAAGGGGDRPASAAVRCCLALACNTSDMEPNCLPTRTDKGEPRRKAGDSSAIGENIKEKIKIAREESRLISKYRRTCSVTLPLPFLASHSHSHKHTHTRTHPPYCLFPPNITVPNFTFLL